MMMMMMMIMILALFCQIVVFVDFNVDFFEGRASRNVESFEQCSKPLLVDDSRGLYYPSYWGFCYNPTGNPTINQPGFNGIFERVFFTLLKSIVFVGI